MVTEFVNLLVEQRIGKPKTRCQVMALSEAFGGFQGAACGEY